MYNKLELKDVERIMFVDESFLSILEVNKKPRLDKEMKGTHFSIASRLDF